MQEKGAPGEVTEGNPSRQSQARPWISPQVVRLRAGDAETGVNPARPEGSFAFGS
jgi:hypothetical protein